MPPSVVLVVDAVIAVLRLQDGVAAQLLAAVARGEDVDPALYYMRTKARFITADPRYAWLSGMIVVGTGARLASAVVLTAYEVV